MEVVDFIGEVVVQNDSIFSEWFCNMEVVDSIE